MNGKSEVVAVSNKFDFKKVFSVSNRDEYDAVIQSGKVGCV